MKKLFKKHIQEKVKKIYKFEKYNTPDKPDSQSKKPHSLLRQTEIPKAVIEHFIEAFSDKVEGKSNPDLLKHAITKMWKKGELGKEPIKSAQEINRKAAALKRYMNQLKNKKA